MTPPCSKTILPFDPGYAAWPAGASSTITTPTRSDPPMTKVAIRRFMITLLMLDLSWLARQDCSHARRWRGRTIVFFLRTEMQSSCGVSHVSRGRRDLIASLSCGCWGDDEQHGHGNGEPKREAGSHPSHHLTNFFLGPRSARVPRRP